MHYNQATHNSFVSSLYSERSSHQPLLTDSWRIQPEPHLNPLKSKINFPQPPSKIDQYSSLNPAFISFRTSCLLNNPSTTIAPRAQFQEDRYFRTNNKENQDLSSERNRDGTCRYSQILTTSSVTEDLRRKSDSVHIKINKEDFLSRYEDDGDDVKLQLKALTKRIVANQEEVRRLKQQMGQGIGWEVTQLRQSLTEQSKQQHLGFREFQRKLQQAQSGFMEVRQKLGSFFSQQEMGRRIFNFQMKLGELYQGFKMRQESSSKNIRDELQILQIKISEAIQKNIIGLRQIVDHDKLDLIDLRNKLKSIQQIISNQNIQQLKKSNRICTHPLLIRTKQQILPDRRVGAKIQKEFIIKERTYFIDQIGYLLDENQYYLLNSSNQQIKIPEKMLEKLQELGILEKTIKSSN